MRVPSASSPRRSHGFEETLKAGPRGGGPMRALLALAAVALLALPALPALPAEETPAGAVPLSHGFFTPYMHLAALNLAEGIRPGAWVQINGGDCTLSFVLRDTLGRLYITTAGHCTGALGQRAAITHDALVAAAAPPMEFGTLVARSPCVSGAATCPGNQRLDAALVRIDADKYGLVNPSMVGWGGPTGLLTTIPADGSETLHHGWGWVTWYDQQTRCRRGSVAAEWWGANSWWVAEIGGGGDSGSAVMTADGLAIGILDWGGGNVVPTLVTSAFVSDHVGGVRLDKVIAAWNAQGWGLSLVTGGPVNPVCMPEPALPV